MGTTFCRSGLFHLPSWLRIYSDHPRIQTVLLWWCPCLFIYLWLCQLTILRRFWYKHCWSSWATLQSSQTSRCRLKILLIKVSLTRANFPSKGLLHQSLCLNHVRLMDYSESWSFAKPVRLEPRLHKPQFSFIYDSDWVFCQYNQVWIVYRRILDTKSSCSSQYSSYSYKHLSAPS